jgi:hypothetical protein
MVNLTAVYGGNFTPSRSKPQHITNDDDDDDDDDDNDDTASTASSLSSSSSSSSTLMTSSEVAAFDAEIRRFPLVTSAPAPNVVGAIIPLFAVVAVNHPLVTSALVPYVVGVITQAVANHRLLALLNCRCYQHSLFISSLPCSIAVATNTHSLFLPCFLLPFLSRLI